MILVPHFLNLEAGRGGLHGKGVMLQMISNNWDKIQLYTHYTYIGLRNAAEAVF
jgi:hypothetical protein